MREGFWGNRQTGLSVQRNKGHTRIQAGIDHGQPGRHGFNLDDAKGFAARHRGQGEQIGGVIIGRDRGIVDFAREDDLFRHSQPGGEILKLATQWTIAHNDQPATHRGHGSDKNVKAFVIDQATNADDQTFPQAGADGADGFRGALLELRGVDAVRNHVAAIAKRLQHRRSGKIIRRGGNNGVAFAQRRVEQRLKQAAQNLLLDGVAMVGDHQWAAMAARQISQHGRGVGQMNVHQAVAKIANARDHSGRDGSGKGGEQRRYARHGHRTDDLFQRIAILARHNDAHIGMALQCSAQSLQMSFDASHVRGIELADVQDAKLVRFVIPADPIQASAPGGGIWRDRILHRLVQFQFHSNSNLTPMWDSS